MRSLNSTDEKCEGYRVGRRFTALASVVIECLNMEVKQSRTTHRKCDNNIEKMRLVGACGPSFLA